MPLRVAFIGFQTGHGFSLYQDLKAHPEVKMVAVCEEDASMRDKVAAKDIAITHTSYDGMLRDVECDVVACADFYSLRGPRMIQAMEAGRHVISDKPLCTRLEHASRMQELANAKHLKVGCQLPLPYAPALVAARNLIKAGAIGAVHTVTFNGAHSLNYTGRQNWMFEPEKYGGSINDIAIHGVDALPWMTGRELAAVTVAREWNARIPDQPKFRDGAVLLYKLDNGGAAYGDVSWLSPDNAGYKVPFYWRFTILGSAGAIETGFQFEKTLLYKAGQSAVIEEPGVDPAGRNYVSDFVSDIANAPVPDGLTTDRVLKSTRATLLAQQAADTGARDVAIS